MKTFFPCRLPKIFFGRRSNRSFRAHPLGHRESAAEELIQLPANGSDRTSSSVGFLNLPKNLRLAEHHRIQTRGHTEDVPHGVLLAELVKMRVERTGVHVKVIAQESAKIGVSVHSERDDLDAVAGRDHHTLFDSRISCQLSAGIRQARLRDGQPLADFQRRALMVQSNELISHAPNLCIAEK
jgi:hypothetical protein